MIALAARGTPDLGSQRVVLYSAECAPALGYGQATKVTFELPEGDTYTCICAVTALSHQASSLLQQPYGVTAVAVDPCVECLPTAQGRERAKSSQENSCILPPSSFERALSALRAAGAAPAPASIRPLTAAPVIAKRAEVLVTSDLRENCWVVTEKLQQRLVALHCLVHFALGSFCLVRLLEPPAPAGSVYRIVRSTQISVHTPEEAAKVKAAAAAAEAAEAAAAADGAAAAVVKGGCSSGGNSSKPKGAAGRSTGAATAKGRSGAEQSSSGPPAAIRRRSAPPAAASSISGPSGSGKPVARGGTSGGSGSAARRRPTPPAAVPREGGEGFGGESSEDDGSLIATGSAFGLLGALGADD